MKWRRLSRRAFLGGAGTTVALPFFESIVPREARAADPIQRAVFVFSPNGFVWDSIYPNAPGANYKTPASLMPLEKHRAKLGLAFHLDNSEGRFPGDHASGTGAALTCVRPKGTAGSDIAAGVSIDQAIVQGLGKLPTKYPYLNLGFTHSPGANAGSDFGVSLLYTVSVSWESATKQLPIIVGPGNAFDMLFTGSSPDANAADQAKRAQYRKSVLDFNLAEANDLKGKLGQGDQNKLERYMSSVRDLEKTLSSTPGAGGACSPKFAKPERIPGKNYYSEWVSGWYQIMNLALQCDLTRVATFMMGPGFSNQSYGFLGINGGTEYVPDSMHHMISHHGGDGGRLSKLRTIDKFTFTKFGEFVDLMDGVDEGGGRTLLDNTVACIVSDVAEGDHNHANFPVVYAGSAGGKLKTGQYWNFKGRKLADLFTTFLEAFGIRGKKHGVATGPIMDLLM